MKVNKQIRNLLMEQPETVMISRTNCEYLGKKYTFVPVTNAETLKRIYGVLDILKPFVKKHWWEFWK